MILTCTQKQMSTALHKFDHCCCCCCYSHYSLLHRTKLKLMNKKTKLKPMSIKDPINSPVIHDGSPGQKLKTDKQAQNPTNWLVAEERKHQQRELLSAKTSFRVSTWPDLTSTSTNDNTDPRCMQSTGTLMQSEVLMCDVLKSSRLRMSINRTLTLDSRRRRHSPADVIPPGGAALSTLNHNISQNQRHSKYQQYTKNSIAPSPFK